MSEKIYEQDNKFSSATCFKNYFFFINIDAVDVNDVDDDYDDDDDENENEEIANFISSKSNEKRLSKEIGIQTSFSITEKKNASTSIDGAQISFQEKKAAVSSKFGV